MDGTGDLFRDFVAALPQTLATTVLQYPRDRISSHLDLLRVVETAISPTEPYVLLGESWSTPLAIQFTASRPANLRGLILCAGFASSPANSLLRPLISLAAPILLRGRAPAWVIRRWMAGAEAPRSLVREVQAAIRSVQPRVLGARLREIMACDARAALRQIVVPVLYLQARDDRVVSAGCVAEIQAIKPDVRVKALVGPHLLLQRNPSGSAAAVVEFVGQCQ
jgi:pimeloyl-[acyl-carrier protein] methyl ester esterase